MHQLVSNLEVTLVPAPVLSTRGINDRLGQARPAVAAEINDLESRRGHRRTMSENNFESTKAKRSGSLLKTTMQNHMHPKRTALDSKSVAFSICQVGGESQSKSEHEALAKSLRKNIFGIDFLNDNSTKNKFKSEKKSISPNLENLTKAFQMAPETSQNALDSKKGVNSVSWNLSHASANNSVTFDCDQVRLNPSSSKEQALSELNQYILDLDKVTTSDTLFKKRVVGLFNLDLIK